MIKDELLADGEFLCAGLFEDEKRSLFYRKSLGLKRFYENCELSEYHGELLYPSGAAKRTPYYLTDLLPDQVGRIKDPEISRKYREEFLFDYAANVPSEHRVAGNMYTHSMPYYERILKEGLLSYIPRINRISDRDMRDGLLLLVEGIREYIERCVGYLESVKADTRLINALKKAPLYPADSIYEAVVGWNFIMYFDGCDNLGCVADGIYPYYKGEDIVPLLENLFDNLDANNGYSMSLGMTYHPVTAQCLKAIRGKRRPMTELFVGKDTPDEIWKLAFEAIRSGGGQLAFYNKEKLPRILMDKFSCLTEADARRFCGGGCTESMIAGLSNVGSLDAGINLLLILEKTIYGSLVRSDSFSVFCDAYLEEVERTVNTVTDAICLSQKQRAEHNPLPLRTLLIDDCIDKGLDYNNGGARYKWSIINFAGLINVIDSLLVIRDMVFEDKKISAGEFVRKLRDGDTDFLNLCRNHTPCYGSGDPDVNEFAHFLSSRIFSMLDGRKPYIGESFIPASIQFMSQVDAGRLVGATPDGRACGEPLCDSLAAIFGKDRNGPTSLLESVTSIALDKACGIPVLNFNLTAKFDDNILKALILGYMELGGIQMQITCSSKEQLLDAYAHPELYGNLVVRVGGYSEYFNRLSNALKRMVIDRSIQEV